MRLSKIIIKPIITEKTTNMVAEDRYVFKVDLKASKKSIKSDLKRIFDIDIIDVKTMIMPGKKKRILKTKEYTKTSKWKKAIVKIKEGQSIDLFPKD